MELTAVRRGSRADPAPPDQQSAPALVGVVWMLLVINTLGSGGAGTVIPIPTSVAQLVTMGALVIAFALALLLNPGLRVRPSGYLLLLTLLLVVSIVSSASLQSGVGALGRSARLAVFIATLWLLSRWWDGTLHLVRHHIRALGAVLASVAIGLVVAPGLAMPAEYEGRLVGVLWYLPPPQVAHFAAVVAGLTLVLWLTRHIDRWTALWVAGPAIFLLLLSHTRTATIGLIAGLAVAGSSLVLTSGRARRVFACAILGAGLVAVAFGPAMLNWFRRGQGDDALENLTGRQKVWEALLAEPRTTHQQLFGVGLTDKSFGGLPIDSGWLAVYHEQGLIGVAIVAAFLAGLVVAAAMRPPSPARACAAFLIVYSLVASYTEVGLGDASLYLLDLAVVAALLAPGKAETGSRTTVHARAAAGGVGR